MSDASQPDLTTLTVQLLSAYVANNSVASEDLAGLIRTTRSALEGQQQPVEPEAPAFVPAVSVRKSLSSPTHILSLIDGKPYKTLKRHLASNGLTPAEYRDRYGLAKDYPMVAPAFAEARRAIAERIGLGRKRSTKVAPTAPVKPEVAAPVSPAEAAPIVKKSRAKAAPVEKAAAKPVKGRTKALKQDGTAPVDAAPASPVKARKSKPAIEASVKPARRAKLKIAVGDKAETPAPKATRRPRKPKAEAVS